MLIDPHTKNNEPHLRTHLFKPWNFLFCKYISSSKAPYQRCPNNTKIIITFQQTFFLRSNMAFSFIQNRTLIKKILLLFTKTHFYYNVKMCISFRPCNSVIASPMPFDFFVRDAEVIHAFLTAGPSMSSRQIHRELVAHHY